MSLPPADRPFLDEEEDRKRRTEIEEMMRWQREAYFRDEPVQQEYRDIVDRQEARREAAERAARGPSPFDLALAAFLERRAGASEDPIGHADAEESAARPAQVVSNDSNFVPKSAPLTVDKRLLAPREAIEHEEKSFGRDLLGRPSDEELDLVRARARPQPVRVAQNQRAVPASAPSQQPSAPARPAAPPKTGQPLTASTPSPAAGASAPADRIFVTYNETIVPGTFHTAIHYQRVDPSGKVIAHQVVEATPEHRDLSLPMKVIGTIEGWGKRSGPSVFGNIQGEIREGEPEYDSKLPYELIAEEGDLSRNWQKILDYVEEFNTKGYAYRGEHQNSNTFASVALRAGRLPAATGIGTDPTDKPGNRWEYLPLGLNGELDPPVGISK